MAETTGKRKLGMDNIVLRFRDGRCRVVRGRRKALLKRRALYFVGGRGRVLCALGVRVQNGCSSVNLF